MVIVDLGRPERMLNLFRYGRIQSPILWDVLSVSTYLTGCAIYLYIPMIPDLGMLAETSHLPAWRRRLYKKLSLGWTGSPEQWSLLERSISVMAVMIIPRAISVHTVVSWIFAMNGSAIPHAVRLDRTISSPRECERRTHDANCPVW